jgi:hypothetical protein
MNGWIEGDSNSLGIQGAVFAFVDPESHTGLDENFDGSNACISGKAVKVDLKCTPIARATDCFGTFWGAAIGLNLNQSIDPATNQAEAPMPHDASALMGFAFRVTGSKVPQRCVSASNL